MKVYRGLHELEGKFKSPAVTLGNFDGVHKGHGEIFRRLKKRAAEIGGEALIFTFDPHPAKILRPDLSPSIITPLSEKLSLIEEYGLDGIILADFNKEFAAQHPASFVKDILHGKLGAKLVMIGHDFTFGKGKEGNIDSLTLLGKEAGFSVEVVEAIKLDGEIVSSTKVRELIKEGRVKEASRLLGRHHSIEGTVIKGHGRGKPLGFPTANIDFHAELLPKYGVYAVKASLGQRQLRGVTNIGIKPTFNDDEPSIETHIFDFDESIYGQDLKVSFVDRVRDVRTFNNPQDLSDQIAKDIGKAKQLLNR